MPIKSNCPAASLPCSGDGALLSLLWKTFNYKSAYLTAACTGVFRVPMNILIPLAGKDPEFEKRGLFKPLVDVGGSRSSCAAPASTPRFFRRENKLTFIVLAEHEKKFSASSRLKGLYPRSSVLIMPKPSEGAACTALFAKGAIGGSGPLAIYPRGHTFRDGFRSRGKALQGGRMRGLHPLLPLVEQEIQLRGQGEGKLASRVAEKDAISQTQARGSIISRTAPTSWKRRSGWWKRGCGQRGVLRVPGLQRAYRDGKKVLIEDVEFISGLGNIAEIEAFRKSVGAWRRADAAGTSSTRIGHARQGGA